MAEQITDTIMMIRPVAFHLNEETAVNNHFQDGTARISGEEAQRNAAHEFDAMVDLLRSNEVKVLVFEDRKEAQTPDSIFPNNWNSFHESGEVFLYPMFAVNRRRERRDDILKVLREQFQVKSLHDFTHWEAKGHFLEGTGSLILDRPNQLAYAAISERTQPETFGDFEANTGFKVVSFHANATVDGVRKPIYHTNVMMCLGEHFCVICSDSIDDVRERQQVLDKLQETKKEIIEISETQKDHFAGNMLQVRNKKGDRFVMMSEAAFQALTVDQVARLEKHGKLLHTPLGTIERLGGGSARCMMAEVFLPKK